MSLLSASTAAGAGAGGCSSVGGGIRGTNTRCAKENRQSERPGSSLFRLGLQVCESRQAVADVFVVGRVEVDANGAIISQSQTDILGDRGDLRDGQKRGGIRGHGGHRTSDSSTVLPRLVCPLFQALTPFDLENLNSPFCSHEPAQFL